MEPAEAIAAAVAALREPLPAELDAYAAAEDVSTREGLDGQGRPRRRPPRRRTLSGRIRCGRRGLGCRGIAVHHRPPHEGAACDLAVDRMKSYAEVTKALNALLRRSSAGAAATGAAVCPMCGLGACGCIWASLHNIDLAWGGAGLTGPTNAGPAPVAAATWKPARGCRRSAVGSRRRGRRPGGSRSGGASDCLTPPRHRQGTAADRPRDGDSRGSLCATPSDAPLTSRVLAGGDVPLDARLAGLNSIASRRQRNPRSSR